MSLSLTRTLLQGEPIEAENVPPVETAARLGASNEEQPTTECRRLFGIQFL
jgi:hypothetical protein